MASGYAFKAPLGSLMLSPAKIQYARCDHFVPNKPYNLLPRDKDFEPKAKDRGAPVVCALDQLPLELLENVFMHLDLVSLAAARGVSPVIREFIDNLPVWKHLNKHAKDILEIIHATKACAFITLNDLLMELHQPYCRNCGKIGPFLFLPTCSRCCFDCLQDNPQFTLMPLFHAEINYALSRQSINALPKLRSLTGEYDIATTRVTWDKWMVSYQAVLKAATQEHGSVAKAIQASEVQRQDREKAYHDAIAKWVTKMAERRDEIASNYPFALSGSPPSLHKPRRPRGSGVQPLRPEDFRRWRFMGVAELPYYNVKSKSVEVPMYCFACNFHLKPTINFCPHLRRFYEAFLPSQVPGHFAKCISAKSILGNDNAKRENLREAIKNYVEYKSWGGIPSSHFFVTEKGKLEDVQKAESCSEWKLFDKLTKA
ncbi:hypothetical protein ASPZODRAFT_13620 [Penicilliopsis zonata CBS 506.65]|uniref:F-box domain-containing protein n=1 Tax=Penicilliopsis zonata CBS 506.65 TaxID=1073090 RepID=A0A1L9SP53_9EURO|nr:hypothetical protein ASPZODRAFT_13620 [Penicilliopsis zonata CBS 506.65]OJJ48883.1 hypothetical protein ASPZODRAFT_13620 [Penicilliopsis zonata CBS 506.65]